MTHRSGVLSHFDIDGATLARFLRRIEDGYQPNPYHNSAHAASVLQSLHVILHRWVVGTAHKANNRVLHHSVSAAEGAEMRGHVLVTDTGH